MRLRIKSQRSEVKATYWTGSGPGAPLVFAGEARRMVGSTDEMLDSPTKGYARISARGGIVNTPMTHRQSVYTLYPRTWKQWTLMQPAYVTYEARDDMPTIGEFVLKADHPHYGPVAARLDTLVTQALTEAYARVGRADMEVLVTLAELSETIAFLKDPVEKGLKLVERGKKWLAYYKRTTAINAARLSKFQSSPRWLQAKRGAPVPIPIRPFRVADWKATDVASFWLAIRYGLMPIIYELQDLWKSLQNTGNKPARETVRATATDEVHIAKIASQASTPMSDRIHFMDASFTIKVRAGVLYTPREVTFESQYGLELHRLPAAAYEKIPFSFVADWFQSASTYYDAITARCRSKAILAAWTSSTITYSIVQTNKQIPKGGLHIENGWNGDTAGVETGTIKLRSPTSLGSTAPQIRLKLNTKRVADGLALIHLFLSSRAHTR